jgi:cold shock CspA family protein
MPGMAVLCTGYVAAFDKEQGDGVIKGDDEKLYTFQLDGGELVQAGVRVTFVRVPSCGRNVADNVQVAHKWRTSGADTQ